MLSFLNDVGNYESRKVENSVSESGIRVSTAYTSDEGYETALGDDEGWHPVERYADRLAAEIGHKAWLSFAHKANGKAIKKIGGLYSLVDECEVILSVNV